MSSRPSSPAAAPPLEDDNLLSEILLRLSPQPSSLPRASAVSKRWRSLVSDPRFVRRFHIHHRLNNPLLGFFDYMNFVPTMDPPNRVPGGRISFRFDGSGDYSYLITLGCHHGLVLFFNLLHNKILVWDPVNRIKHRPAFPAGFRYISISGAVLRAAGDVQHFQVVLVGTGTTHAIARVYSSKTGVWGDLIPRALLPKPSMGQLSTEIRGCFDSVLVGNSLYWLLSSSPPAILEFDLDRQRLNVIPVPPVDIYADRYCQFIVTRADGGGLGILFVSEPNFVAQLWKRETNCDGVASWVLGKTIGLNKLLSQDSEKEIQPLIIHAEDNNMVFLKKASSIFTVHLESLQLKKLFETDLLYQYHPFESIYTTGMGIDDGNGGAELLHNT